MFDARATFRAHNPKVGRVTKCCDLREIKRASHGDLRAKDPKVILELSASVNGRRMRSFRLARTVCGIRGHGLYVNVRVASR